MLTVNRKPLTIKPARKSGNQERMMMKKVLLMLCSASLLASVSAMAGNPEAGKEKAKVCAACHGPDGNSVAADFPKLAGQQPDYIVHALQSYKSGKRKNPIMAPQAANLSVADMEDLAAYFSHQHGLNTFK